jgi:PadR family transcriptional regulator PadR
MYLERRYMLQYSDILRGLTDSLILAQLEYGDSYGYEISKTILKESDGSIELKEASLYTSFRRLEEAGYITSYWGDENSGARRRYYTLNDEGKVFITENKEDWKKISKIISDLLSGKKKKEKNKDEYKN